MPHAAVVNHTPFAFEALVLADEESVPQFVTCVQATWRIVPGRALERVEEQPGIDLGGQWRGDPATCSLLAEPQLAFMKPGTDVVLLGHAQAARAGATEGLVGIRVGALQKSARVFGDRLVTGRIGPLALTRPKPFERIPLVYERAFGGWDRRHPDPTKHRFEPRNPVGTGFRTDANGDEPQPAPNFEDPKRPFKGWGDTPPPAGFGFIAANWQPRLAFAGTYDAAWAQSRMPLLPLDFDRRFFNAASPGLVAPAPLRGDEPVSVIGACKRGRLDFQLPGVPPPVCVLGLRGRRRMPLESRLDTVIVDMDLGTLTLLWRACRPVRNGSHDVLDVEVHPDLGSASRVQVAATSVDADE